MGRLEHYYNNNYAWGLVDIDDIAIGYRCTMCQCVYVPMCVCVCVKVVCQYMYAYAYASSLYVCVNECYMCVCVMNNDSPADDLGVSITEELNGPMLIRIAGNIVPLLYIASIAEHTLRCHIQHFARRHVSNDEILLLCP